MRLVQAVAGAAAAPRETADPGHRERDIGVRLIAAEADDPEIMARVVAALADVLAGRVG